MKQSVRDSSGKRLEDYKRPSVAVDAAVLSVDPDRGLVVLQVRGPRKTRWALPGTFLHFDEVLSQAVQRCLDEKANVRGVNPRQLRVFDAIKRDSRYRVLSVAHVAVVGSDQLAGRFPDTTRLVPVGHREKLAFDHNKIIDLAVQEVRSRYHDKPDPDHLLGREFTLRELRLIHEAVEGRAIQRDNFRRAMENHLEPVGSPESSGRPGRPAQRFRRK